jgi:hypothetical protein
MYMKAALTRVKVMLFGRGSLGIGWVRHQNSIGTYLAAYDVISRLSGTCSISVQSRGIGMQYIAFSSGCGKLLSHY